MKKLLTVLIAGLIVTCVSLPVGQAATTPNPNPPPATVTLNLTIQKDVFGGTYKTDEGRTLTLNKIQITLMARPDAGSRDVPYTPYLETFTAGQTKSVTLPLKSDKGYLELDVAMYDAGTNRISVVMKYFQIKSGANNISCQVSVPPRVPLVIVN